MSKNNAPAPRQFLVKKNPKDPLRVLVSWSPQSAGSEALELAAWIGRTTRIQVRVVSTLYQPWATPLAKFGGKYKKWFKSEATACAEAVAKELAKVGLDKKQLDKKPSVLVDGPSRPRLLTDMAEDFGADLVVLGPTQAAPKGRFVAGSTADALLHYSPVPLGLVPRGVKLSKHGVRRINFAFTERGAEAGPPLLAAAQLAATWSVPLRILAFSADGMFARPLDDQLDVAVLASEWREDALAMLDRAADAVAEDFPELEITTDIGTGSGWSGAVDSLKWKKGDLMYMGSTAQAAFERVFLGSTATALLPHLRVPVVVRPDAL